MTNNNYKKHKKIQDLFYRKRLIEKGFICQNCGKELKTFNSRHLKKCGLDKGEYIEAFGYPNEYYEKDAILEKITKKIEELYVMDREKWLILNGDFRGYITKDSEKIKEENLQKDREFNQLEKLTQRQVIDHFKGKNTLGVFPKWNSSKFLVIDVDSYVGLQQAKIVTWHIKWFLKKYFPSDQIHVNYSGNKGYHITLYFDRFINIKTLYRLFTIILNWIQVEDFKDVRVEMRPTIKGKDGYGVKLPLGVNFINKDDYNNYAYYVDDYFKEIEYEIDYVLNIEKSSSGIVWQIINEYRNNKLKDYGENYLNIEEVENTNEINYKAIKDIEKNEYDKIEWILENGLEEKGTRHYWSFLIALYYKENDIDENEAFDLLYEWSKDQIEKGMSKSSITEVVRDIKQIIYRGVYNPEKTYCLFNKKTYAKDIYLTRKDIEKFIELNIYAKKYGKTVISHQEVLFAIIIHEQTYRDTNNENFGAFYMTYNQIMKLTGLGSENTVNKCITELDKLGFIKIIDRNKKFDKEEMKKGPNVYKIQNQEEKIEENIVIKVSPEELKDQRCFYRVFYRYFGRDEIGSVFTRHIKYKVINMNLDKLD